MDEVKKMLRAVVNGQSSLKQELLLEIKKVDQGLKKRIGGLGITVHKGFKAVNGRLDKQGRRQSHFVVKSS